MKLRLFLAMNSFLVACFSHAVNAETPSPSRQTADANYSGEVLAEAPFRNGRGSIEVRRITEDGVDGVAIVRTGLVGDVYTRPAIRPDTLIADQMHIVYDDLTGQALPRKAYEALLDVEALKVANAAKEQNLNRLIDDGYTPRNQTCPDITAWYMFFVYDCYWHGNIVKIRNGTDDVCLLTAAIDGNHSMQISYKAINGNFYDSYHADVMQGHYKAATLITGVKRSRKGHIYNATNDYSRFLFVGDFTISKGYPDHLTCDGVNYF